MIDDQTPDQKLKHWRDKFTELRASMREVPLDQLTPEELAELQSATAAVATAIEEKVQAERWWNWQSSDGMVQADMDTTEGDPLCQIYNIVAHEQRKGHGRRAMQELRSKYSSIRVIGIGSEGNPNRLFWLAMARQGLVDVMLDTDGRRVWPVHEQD